MGAVEYWRNRLWNLCLEGHERTTPEGNKEVSINGSNWVESPNGRHREKKPQDTTVIYQAQNIASDNGREPVEVRGTVEISASED